MLLPFYNESLFYMFVSGIFLFRPINHPLIPMMCRDVILPRTYRYHTGIASDAEKTRNFVYM